MKYIIVCCIFAVFFCSLTYAHQGYEEAIKAQRDAGIKGIPVNVDNFDRAETNDYMQSMAKSLGLFGKFYHYTEFMPIEVQEVVRPNRDTLYSGLLLDLDAGPATITLPDLGSRFMSMAVVDEDHFLHMIVYEGGKYVLSRDKIPTRYTFIILRTFADPSSAEDLETAQKLQNAITLDQPGGPGKMEFPVYDLASLKTTRDAYKILFNQLDDTKGMFGTREEIGPTIRHSLGTAAAWGGNSDKDALYLNITPKDNSGEGIYKMHIPSDVPIRDFWSISVYDKDGYFAKNEFNSYTLNNVTCKKNDDGSMDVQFGGCTDKTINCLPIFPGWTYFIRLYRPDESILRGTWTFPDLVPEDDSTQSKPDL